jgi:sec-independent protein translocase protein TatA
MAPPIAFGFGIGWAETLAVAGIALLLFGRRIPEIARSLGRSVVEFRRGLRGAEPPPGEDEAERA